MLNLDTHILIFALSGKLTIDERQALDRDEWSIAAIVVWEIAKLAQRGRIEMDLHSPLLRDALDEIHIWPLTPDVCRRLVDLDFRSDPADELIAATSVVHNIPLMTRDRLLRRSKIVPLAQ